MSNPLCPKRLFLRFAAHVRRIPLHINSRSLCSEFISQTPNSEHNKPKLSVLVHLYFLDLWPEIEQTLQSLTVDFRLYISIGNEPTDFTDDISDRFPGTMIFKHPNHGRDIFPFLTLARKASKESQYFLKLHTKKSTYGNRGARWRRELYSGLVPKDQDLQELIIKTLENPETGIVGTSKHFYKGSTYFDGNAKAIGRALRKIGRRPAFEQFERTPDSFGFFAGTMFWGRFDSIDELLYFNSFDFDYERGQTDATFAHALERLFCFIPQIDGRKTYLITNASVDEVAPNCGISPNWCE